MKRIQLYLSEYDLLLCDQLKEKTGENRSATIRRALTYFYSQLNKDDKKCTSTGF